MTRRAFTTTEIVAALAILAAVLLIVADVGLWSIRERLRHAVRQEALETASNVLEAARALPFDALTQEWADKQRLPEALAEQLDEGKLIVRVESEKDQPLLKRISVEIQGNDGRGGPAAPIRLTTLRSARMGGTP